MRQYFLILDIETIDKPKDWNASATDVDNWPEILEIAWQLYTYNKELIIEKSLIVSQNKISKEIQQLTGITINEVQEKGINAQTVLNEFLKILKKFKPILVSHNNDFDLKVIEAHFIKHQFNDSLNNYTQICTMKGSVKYCNLSNLKYPKLSELYEILFGFPPNKSHRALYDVQNTSDSFFKLLDLGEIELNTQNTFNSNLEKLDSEQIDKAINHYIEDITQFPIFYDLKIENYLYDQNFNEEVKNKYNKFYQTSKATSFEIPYNQVINREVLALKVEDIIIRYIVINHLRDKTNFIPSIEKYDDKIVSDFCQNEINKGNSVLVKVDIANCYESINHELLVNEVKKELELLNDSTFLQVIDNGLKVIFEDKQGMVKKKEQGLLIGSKPDEYLAEYFLDKVENYIKHEGVSILRIADEFILFTSDFQNARNQLKTIQKTIEGFDLSLNNAKTTINDYRAGVVDQKLSLDVVFVEATHPFLKFTLSDFKDHENQTDNKTTESNTDGVDISAIEINSYESAILFLKKMLVSQNDIINYQEKHPENKFLYNVVYSQPTDLRNDFYHLNKEAYFKSNLEKLKKVIYYYPKSEYYTALAIQLLTFVATNTVEVIDRFKYNKFEEDEISEKYYYLHQACEFANLTIIELLQSKDIHEYQKYLIFRTLFSNKNQLNLDLDAYDIVTLAIDFNDGIGVANKLPFKQTVLKEAERLSNCTTHYPLKMICQELTELNAKD